MILAVELEIVDLADLRERMRDDPDFTTRLLTAEERSWCLAQVDAAPGIAARLAAKTATLRALGIGETDRAWHEVEVVRERGGRPTLRLSGGAAETARARAVHGTHVSLTHARDQAAAAIVLEG